MSAAWALAMDEIIKTASAINFVFIGKSVFVDQRRQEIVDQLSYSLQKWRLLVHPFIRRLSYLASDCTAIKEGLKARVMPEAPASARRKFPAGRRGRLG
jgi:hypothetical protein